MQLFKKILFVHDNDRDDQANFTRAVELAGESKAELTVLQVIDQLPRDFAIMITSLPEKEIVKLAVREQTHRLEKIVFRVAGRKTINIKVVVGREYLEIIKEVLQGNHDLVMKTVRGRGGVMGALFGSTAMHLLRECPCPVWLIHPDMGKQFKRIMVAVDVTPGEEEGQVLNDQIMKLAVSLSEQGKSELDIIHTWKKIDENFPTYAADYFPDDHAGIIKETENMHIGWLDSFLSRHDLNSICHHEYVLQGWADEIIVDFVQGHDIDLIVMGTVCRTGISGFFIGNTAEKILNRVQCSVLALKPEGFISPVQISQGRG